MAIGKKGKWVASAYLDKDCWETPDDLFKAYDDTYHFVLDAAANDHNHKCGSWLGPGGIVDDALSVSWRPWLDAGHVWLNPPYSRGNQRKFVAKAIEEVNKQSGHRKVIALLPADTSTKLFHELILPFGHITFLKGRVQFKGAPGKPKFASMIVMFKRG